MAVRIEQPGAAKAAAKAGLAIGKGQKAEKQREAEERQLLQTQQIEARRAAQKTAMQWELQKMQMRSEQDFQQELRDRQFQYDRINEAKAWDIEKMRIASEMDFQREEVDRQRKLTRIDTAVAAIEKEKEEGRFTGDEFQYQNLKLHWEQQRIAAETGLHAPSAALIRPQKEDEFAAALKGLTGEKLTDSVTTGDTVRMKSPTGQVYDVPAQNVDAALAAGATKIETGFTPVKSEAYSKFHAEWLEEQKKLGRKEKVREFYKTQASKPRTSIYGIR